MHMRRKIIDARQLDLKEKVVEVRRVTKVVKGGRNFRFAALVVVGDENGHVGIGTGKAMEVPDAIKKAVEDAKKNLINVPIVGTTIPHEVHGHFGAGKILVMPAKQGTGVIAGGPARAVLELAGLTDVRAKSLGTNNPRNMVNATIEGLKSLKRAEDIAKLKIKLVRSIIGTTPNQKKNVEALGLRKREQVVVKEDNAQIRGMIAKVSHLVEVTEIAE